MNWNFRSKVRRIALEASGRFNHIRRAADVKRKWYGNDYGGFYVHPDALTRDSIVYSFGIGEDISFDEAIIKNHHCRVFGFDPTPKSIDWINGLGPKLPSGFSFFEYGISDQSGPVDFYLPKNSKHVSGSFISHSNVDDKQRVQVEMRTLPDIAEQLSHTRIDVLKIDIEGAEYQVAESIATTAIQIDQILIEFHERFFTDGQAMTEKTIRLLAENGYKIFAFSDSFEEVSFIHQRLIP